MFTLDQPAESVEESPQFNFPEPGKYNARISSAKIEMNPKSGKTNLVVIFITENPIAGKQITKWYPTIAKSQSWIVKLFRVAGLKPMGKNLDENMLINRQVQIDVKREGENKVSVQWVNPAGPIEDNPVLDQREQELKDSQMDMNTLPDSSSSSSPGAQY